MQVGVVVVVLAFIGVWAKIIKQYLLGEKVGMIWASLVAMFVASYIRHIIIPAAFSQRYLLVTMPAIILFSAAGLDYLVSCVSSVGKKNYVYVSAFIIAAVMFGVNNFYLHSIDNSGFQPVYESVSKEIGDDKNVILIVSDVFGEGSVIASAATESDSADITVLRGSKVFIHEDWMGRHSDEKFSSVEEITQVLENIPVDVVIFDVVAIKKRQKNYHALLETALNQPGSK